MSHRLTAAALGWLVASAALLSGCGSADEPVDEPEGASGVISGEAVVQGEVGEETAEPFETVGEWYQQKQSVNLFIDNLTDEPLTLEYRTQLEGSWEGKGPGNIPPQTSRQFRFVNEDNPTFGIRNELTYRLPDGGEVRMYYQLPFLSLHAATMTVPQGYRGDFGMPRQGNENINVYFVFRPKG